MTLGTIRLWTLVFPPVGLFLLWTGRSLRWSKKVLGTIGILLYSLIYGAAVIASLVRFDGLEVEWRGGYAPSFTYAKAVPNYARLEAHRRAQRASRTRAVATTNQTEAYWTGFRGPRRDGIYDEAAIRTDWASAPPRLLWRQPSGGGYASFAVAQGLAFTLEQRRENEVAAAYDLKTGQEIWTNSWPGHFQESMGGDGPRATPTYEGGRVYALGAEGELRCLEASTGEVKWSRNILRDNQAGNITYGMAGSPLILSNQVIVQPGGSNGKSVVAYDKGTGERIWGALNDSAAYSSPMSATLAGQEQILIVTQSRAVGLDPRDGQLLWEYPWVVQYGNVNIAQPVILSSNSFFLSAGYGTGCAAVEVRRDSSRFQARTLWNNKFLKNKFTSSVYWQGYLYGLDEDILVCLDAKTGARQWKEGRYGYGQLILAMGHLIILTGSGELALVPARSEQPREIFRFQAISGKTWNHPALAEGRLLVRNSVEMACFDLSATRVR